MDKLVKYDEAAGKLAGYNETLDTLKEGTEVAKFLQRHHNEIGQNVSKLALAAENQSLLQRLFPGKLDKVFSDAKIREATTELAFRHAALELSAKSKMEAVEEQCQSMVRLVKVHHRTQFTQFVTDAFEKLRQDIDEKMKRSLEASEEKYNTYLRFKELPTAEIYLRHLLATEENYVAWLRKLLDNFQSIVDEKVRQYQL